MIFKFNQFYYFTVPTDTDDETADSISVKKAPVRRTRKTNQKQNIQQEEDLSSISAKKTPARITRKTNQKQNVQQKEDSTLTLAKVPRTRTRKVNQKQNIQQEEDSSSTPVKESLVEITQTTRKQNVQQESSLVSTQKQKNSLANSLSDNNDFEATSPVHSTQDQPHILSDDEDSSTSSVTNNNDDFIPTAPRFTSSTILHSKEIMQPLQKDLYRQELFQKRPKETRHEIEELNLQSKRPTQFQNMPNDFEIAYWIANHKKILDLAINIRNGMMSNANEEYETTVTSSSSKQQFSLESALTPSEIDQVIYNK